MKFLCAFQMMMNKIEKVEIFKNVLGSIMFSRTFQFEYNGIIEFNESSTGDNYKSKFSNESRSLKINMRLASENDVLGERMSITIFKEDQVDSDDDEPYFLLIEWLDSRGREKERKKFYLNSYEGSFEEKLKSFFRYINTLFEDEELAKVLRGETWMNFGFDWRECNESDNHIFFQYLRLFGIFPASERKIKYLEAGARLHLVSECR